MPVPWIWGPVRLCWQIITAVLPRSNAVWVKSCWKADAGRCKLDCGMGEIAASLVAPSEYGYRVKVGMGDVRVGDNQFGGMGGTYKVNTGAENFFDINCGMGAVKVLFEE